MDRQPSLPVMPPRVVCAVGVAGVCVCAWCDRVGVWGAVVCAGPSLLTQGTEASYVFEKQVLILLGKWWAARCCGASWTPGVLCFFSGTFAATGWFKLTDIPPTYILTLSDGLRSANCLWHAVAATTGSLVLPVVGVLPRARPGKRDSSVIWHQLQGAPYALQVGSC